MNIIGSLFLYTLNTHGYTYFVVLSIGALVLAYLVVTMYLLNKDKVTLERSIAHLSNLRRRGVEYELVLQAMKLATWRIDLTDKSLTFDNDYRTRSDLFVPIPGMKWNDLQQYVHEDDLKGLLKAIEMVVTGKQNVIHAQYRMRKGNGEYYWAEAYGTVAERDEHDAPMILVGTTRFIDDQKKMEHDIIEARHKAEESDRLKSAFIANISHEVRTPLNAIIGFSDVLPSITDDAERESLMGIIKENNAKLLQIFEDMMNISKMEATDDKTHLDISTFNLVELVAEKVAKFRTDNAEAKFSIDIATKEQTVEMTTDKQRVDYIVNHYLENACKFTTEGNITAGVNIMADGKVRFWVSDTGKGIDKQHQEKIFDRFFKVDSFIQGAGLGLSVCQSYALSIGGKVGVESQLGKGSTFWVEMPCKM